MSIQHPVKDKPITRVDAYDFEVDSIEKKDMVSSSFLLVQPSTHENTYEVAVTLCC